MWNIAGVNLQPSMDILALLTKVPFPCENPDNHDALHQTDIPTTIEGLYQITIHFSKNRFFFLQTPFDDAARVNFFSSSLSP